MKQVFPSLDEYLHTIATQEAEIERLRAALIQIEAGYSHPQLSVAEMATIARQALNAAS